MKYYFVSDIQHGTYVVVATSIDRAREIARNADLIVVDLYELTADTFEDEGFLVSSK